MIELTSEITVEEIQQVGSDRAIVCAAWVIPVTATHTPQGKPITDEAVEKVIRFMMEKRHGTPFEHGLLTVRVHAPIKVFREWHRHRIGWSYNETSARYQDMKPVFYVPPRERPAIRPDGFRSMRPAFDVATEHEYAAMLDILRSRYQDAYNGYQCLLNLEVDRGLARDVLGVGLYSSCWCTANPRSIMAFLELRTEVLTARRPSHPLFEIAVAARKLEEIFARYWPVTYRLWNESGRMAP